MKHALQRKETSVRKNKQFKERLFIYGIVLVFCAFYFNFLHFETLPEALSPSDVDEEDFQLLQSQLTSILTRLDSLGHRNESQLEVVGPVKTRLDILIKQINNSWEASKFMTSQRPQTFTSTSTDFHAIKKDPWAVSLPPITQRQFDLVQEHYTCPGTWMNPGVAETPADCMQLVLKHNCSHDYFVHAPMDKNCRCVDPGIDCKECVDHKFINKIGQIGVSLFHIHPPGWVKPRRKSKRRSAIPVDLQQPKSKRKVWLIMQMWGSRTPSMLCMEMRNQIHAGFTPVFLTPELSFDEESPRWAGKIQLYREMIDRLPNITDPDDIVIVADADVIWFGADAPAQIRARYEDPVNFGKFIIGVETNCYTQQTESEAIRWLEKHYGKVDYCQEVSWFWTFCQHPRYPKPDFDIDHRFVNGGFHMGLSRVLQDVYKSYIHMIDTETDPHLGLAVCRAWDDQCLWNAFAIYNNTNMKLDFDVDFVLNGHYHNLGNTRHNEIQLHNGLLYHADTDSYPVALHASGMAKPLQRLYSKIKNSIPDDATYVYHNRHHLFSDICNDSTSKPWLEPSWRFYGPPQKDTWPGWDDEISNE